MVTSNEKRPKGYLYIEEWMAYRGLDDSQMAAKLDPRVKRETFNRYRNHQHRINTTILGQIADILDAEPADLYGPPGFVSLQVPEKLRDTAADMIAVITKRDPKGDN